MCWEFSLSIFISFVGLVIPKPSSLCGKARRSLSLFTGGLHPVRLGISCVLIVSSNDLRCSLALLFTCVRKVHLPFIPCIKATLTVDKMLLGFSTKADVYIIIWAHYVWVVQYNH